MNLKFTLFFAALFALPLTSQAIVGGPFDGNDYSQALDDQGIYQTAMRFKNGSGFSQFGNNVDLVSSTTTTGVSRGSYLNRSIIYCNGIVYIGMASGMVDHEAKVVMGYTNGISTSAGIAASSVTPIVTSSFPTTTQTGGTANTEFTAKIRCIAPELRYSGTGEITILSNNSTNVTSLIQDQISSAKADILTLTDPNAGANETAAQMIAFNSSLLKAQIQAVNALRAFSTSVSSADNGFTQPMTVFGARKFFISRR